MMLFARCQTSTSNYRKCHRRRVTSDHTGEAVRWNHGQL